MDVVRNTARTDRDSASRPIRAFFVRLFFIATIAAMVLDLIPPTIPGMAKPKRVLSAFLNRTGLWQGQWMMFAPNPIINNAYVTAEIVDKNGNQTFWDSPDWKHVGSWEKFYRFRYLNYYNQISASENRRAADDFADYLSQNSLSQNSQSSPVSKLKLNRISMTMVLPEAGTLPAREDTIWISSSHFMTERHYDP